MNFINKEDFKEYDKSKVTQKSINGFGATIYFRKAKDDKRFTISGRGTGFKQPVYIGRVDTIKECNAVFSEICDKLTFLSKFEDNIDLNTFFEELHKQYIPTERQKRFNEFSDDGVIRCYVNKQNDEYVPRVKDFKKGTTEISQAYISPAVPTETEAEEICRNCLNEYNIYGTYHRNLTKRSCILAHEVIEGTTLEIHEEYYICGNGVRTDLTEVQYNSIINILTMGE